MNLTSLFNVKQWVQSTTTTDDALLQRLIAEASRTALNYMQRADTGLTAITEIISGRGETKVQLRNWPVISVTGMTIGPQTIPASTTPTTWGYFLEPVYGSTAGRAQNVGIRGAGGCGVGNNGYSPVGALPAGYGSVALMPPYSGVGRNPFVPGVGNISVAYTYGYAIQNEAQTIPASVYQVTPAAPYGAWASDLGVTYANTGAALTAVASGPTAGQYVPPNLSSPTSPVNYYQFAAADTGRAVLLNYNYIPYDLEQAVIEMIGERYKYRSRIGQASQSLGGQETASYLVRDMLTASIKGRLDPYKLVWGG